MNKCCDGISCYDTGEEIYDPKCGCHCHPKDADLALKRELVAALKVCLFHAKFSHQITDRLNDLIHRAEKTL